LGVELAWDLRLPPAGRHPDGLRIIVQAYVAWQVLGDPGNVQRFMRAVQNQPDEAARQQLLSTCGVRVLQVGIERLTLPSVTLTATVDLKARPSASMKPHKFVLPPNVMRELCSPMPQ
jgi:hypothetical protein